MELLDTLKERYIFQCRQVTQITFEFVDVVFCLFFPFESCGYWPVLLSSSIGLIAVFTYLLQVFTLHVNVGKPSLSLLLKCIQIANWRRKQQNVLCGITILKYLRIGQFRKNDEDRVKWGISDVIKNRGTWPEEVCYYINKLNSSFPVFRAT